jgi:hypothetical protein
MSIVLALAFVPLLATNATTIDLMARAEARGNSPPPGYTAPTTRVLQLDGGLTVAASLNQWRLLAAYQPRLLVSAPNAAGHAVTTPLNNARLSAEYLFSAEQRVRVEQTAMYGLQDFSPLNGAVPGATPSFIPLDPRLPKIVLSMFASVSSLTYTQMISPRLTAVAHTAFQISGGADTLAQSYLPKQRGGLGDAKITWQAGKHDFLSLDVAGSATVFSTRIRTALASAAVSWKTELGPLTVANLSVGGGGARTNFPLEPTGWKATYQTTGGISHTLLLAHQRLTGGLTVSVTTIVDRLNGAPYRLASGQATLGYQPVNDLRFTANASWGRALSGAVEQGQSLTVFDFAAIAQVTPDASLALGVRSATQIGSAAAGIPPGTQWAGYAAITFIPTFLHRGRP